MGFEVLEIKGLPESIEMTNVALRRLGLGDSRDHFDLIDQNREHLRKFMPWEPRTRSLDELEGWIRAGLQKWEDGVCYDYAIFEKSTGRRVGGCGVHSIDWHHHHAELGYWIEAASQGKGWVGETVRALEDVLFGRGFHRIEIRCSAENDRSAQVARRGGYALEGRLREDSIEHGRFRDTLIFGKLRSEWKR